MAFEWSHRGTTNYRLGEDGEIQYFYGDDDTGASADGWEDAIEGGAAARAGLLAAVAALETYRKALEPFAALAPGLFYPGADVIWIECGVPIPSEHWTALREACKLMGIEVPGEDG